MNLDLKNNMLLLGSKDAIEELSKKPSATILVISDTHGNQIIVNKILATYIEKVDLIAFCGDGVKDIIDFLQNPKMSKFFLKKKNLVIAAAQGNGDENIFTVNYNINGNPFGNIINKAFKNNFELVIPKSVLLNVASKNVLITHGHLFGVSYGLLNLQELAKEQNVDLVLFGHTHIAENVKSQNITFVNPGSPTLPRRCLLPSFAIVRIDSKDIDCMFYKVDITLDNGIYFNPYFPLA